MASPDGPPPRPKSATMTFPPATPEYSQLLDSSGAILSQVDVPPPSNNFDLVACDICCKDVPIRWHLNEAGEAVHDIEGHDVECHHVCFNCHDLVTTGVFPIDVPGSGVVFYDHDRLCPAQQKARYCEHCGVAFADKLWFIREHLRPCLEAAEKNGTKRSYFKDSGKYGHVVNGVHWRGGGQRATIGGRNGSGRMKNIDRYRPGETLFPYSDGASDNKSGSGSRREMSPPQGARSRLAQDTSDYVRFYCEHCGIAVTDPTWYLRNHFLKCFAKTRSQLRMYSKHTGSRKNRGFRTETEARLDKGEERKYHPGKIPGDPYYLGAVPRPVAESKASVVVGPSVSAVETRAQSAAKGVTPQPAAKKATPKPAAKKANPQSPTKKKTLQPPSKRKAPQQAAKKTTPQSAAKKTTPQAAATKTTPQPAAQEASAKPSTKNDRTKGIIFDCSRCGVGWADATSFFAHLCTCTEYSNGQAMTRQSSQVPDESVMQEELRQAEARSVAWSPKGNEGFQAVGDAATPVGGKGSSTPPSLAPVSPLRHPSHMPGPRRGAPRRRGLRYRRQERERELDRAEKYGLPY